MSLTADWLSVFAQNSSITLGKKQLFLFVRIKVDFSKLLLSVNNQSKMSPTTTVDKLRVCILQGLLLCPNSVKSGVTSRPFQFKKWNAAFIFKNLQAAPVSIHCGSAYPQECSRPGALFGGGDNL